jgi:hypothetical protein
MKTTEPVKAEHGVGSFWECVQFIQHPAKFDRKDTCGRILFHTPEAWQKQSSMGSSPKL